MTVFLVRHGETELNAGRVVQPPETPLSDRGREQALRLALRLAAAGVAHVLSSDLPRAVETARAVADSAGCRLELCPDLRERDFGSLRGTPYRELREDIFAADFVPPQGESWSQFHDRIDRAWDQILHAKARVAGPLAVVAHGLVCLSITHRKLALAGRTPPFAFGNASVTSFSAAAPYPVGTVNCTAHLEGEGGPSSGPQV